MCNRPRLVIDYQIDYHFFQSNRNSNRVFLQKSNRNRNRNPVKINRVWRLQLVENFETSKINVLFELF
jgi:hypothetical protein